MAEIDALKGTVSIAIKSSVGDLCYSLRSCQATISYTEAFVEQLQQSLNHSDGLYLHLARQFLDGAQIEVSDAQSAVERAIESTQSTMSFFGLDMKPIKVSSCFFSFISSPY